MKSSSFSALYLSACIASFAFRRSEGKLFLSNGPVCKTHCAEKAEKAEWADACSETGCEGCKECMESCAQGWQQLGKSCYIASPTNSDFHGARTWCTDQGADLASIHSEEENAFVLKLCGNGTSCWLGLTEKKGTGDKATPQGVQTWVWADGSDMSNYSNWKWDEPNNWGGKPMTSDERYGGMNGNQSIFFKGKWYDFSPQHQARAICKEKLGVVNVKSTKPSGCPQYWTDFEGKCYAATNQKRSWVESMAWCQQEGADLVSINSAAENAIVDKVCGKRICWIGLSEKGGNAQTLQGDQKWIWNDGTDLSTYSNWKPWGGIYSEPNNWGVGKPMKVDEEKGFINGPWGDVSAFNGFWYDGAGNRQNFAVCEKPAAPQRIEAHSSDSSSQF